MLKNSQNKESFKKYRLHSPVYKSTPIFEAKMAPFLRKTST